MPSPACTRARKNTGIPPGRRGCAYGNRRGPRARRNSPAWPAGRPWQGPPRQASAIRRPSSRPRSCVLSASGPPYTKFHGSNHRELERPSRDHLVLVEQGAARRVEFFIFSFETFKTAIASGGAGIEGEDGVAAQNEAPAQRADRRVGRSPVGRARERRERLDLVAVVLPAARVAAPPPHPPDRPARGLRA